MLSADCVSSRSSQLPDDAHFRVVDEVRFSVSRGTVGCSCVLNVLPSRIDEIISNSADRERMGTPVGFPRHFTAYHNRHTSDRARFQYQVNGRISSPPDKILVLPPPS